MNFDLKAAAILRKLIYPIQFQADPLDGIDRVITQVVFADHTRVPRSDVIAAIDAGLASDAQLSGLIPQSHSEAVIRSFLSALRMHLEADSTRS
ncbi:hypothetical protein P8935_02480 [Telmatobacter sp. DSM 110680]|uniref:Uncharacterized protein n=1 Tax=Telmatobacter sp. DSM 110680 TaxID=3036704 RepID=A0AAU7DLP9_9BACT